jgi:hypothetical protein
VSIFVSPYISCFNVVFVSKIHAICLAKRFSHPLRGGLRPRSGRPGGKHLLAPGMPVTAGWGDGIFASWRGIWEGPPLKPRSCCMANYGCLPCLPFGSDLVSWLVFAYLC